MSSKFYISTAIAYPNAAPHMGHALEFVQADCLARFHRLKGEDVFFSTGTDEHGTKIEKTAKQEGISSQELVDRNSVFFTNLCRDLEIAYDSFYRTSNPLLRTGAQKIWTLLEKSGDIYKKKHTGLYCYGCESFKLEKDLVDGKCENHDRAPEELSEENYFFRLSKYKDLIKEKLINGEIAVYPEFRKTEVINMLSEIADVSFSRPKTSLSWGVEVPSDDSHVMYVWCDALSNYITGLGYVDNSENYNKFWPNDLNVIGKDIIKFHALYWPAMLMSANLPLPKAIMVHGFITSEGKKMSKTLGNIVDPVDVIQKYGSDALRYYLLRDIPTLDDGDFSLNHFIEVYNSELANNIGNLVNRVLVMASKYIGEDVEAKVSNSEVEKTIFQAIKSYNEYFEKFDIKKVVEQVIELVNFANKYIDQTKPWSLAKEDLVKAQEVLSELLRIIHVVGILLLPIIPSKACKILDTLSVDVKDFGVLEKVKESVFYKIKKGDVLFPRIEQL